VRLDRVRALPRLIEPELVRVLGRTVNAERDVPGLPLLDPARVEEQQLENLVRLSVLGDHADEVGDGRHGEI
jgi:hypothetical protein